MNRRATELVYETVEALMQCKSMGEVLDEVNHLRHFLLLPDLEGNYLRGFTARDWEPIQRHLGGKEELASQ